jgi:hypothetical protein
MQNMYNMYNYGKYTKYAEYVKYDLVSWDLCTPPAQKHWHIHVFSYQHLSLYLL